MRGFRMGAALALAAACAWSEIERDYPQFLEWVA